MLIVNEKIRFYNGVLDQRKDAGRNPLKTAMMTIICNLPKKQSNRDR
jgi:hypothetical protein